MQKPKFLTETKTETKIATTSGVSVIILTVYMLIIISSAVLMGLFN